MTPQFSRSLFLAAGWAGACIFASRATAGPIDIHADMGNSTEGIGDFSGTVEYTFTGGNTGTLIVELANTSVPSNGGKITAFVFNINSVDDGALATLVDTTNANFLNLSGSGLNAPPFGSYEAGAGLHGQWLGGGSPHAGIAVGDSALFTFGVIASDAGLLDSMDFIAGETEFDFVVRFRGFNDGGSDKVPGVPCNLIPLPAPVLMGAIGLPLAALFARRARRQAAKCRQFSASRWRMGRPRNRRSGFRVRRSG